ncbi:hypothetical protein E4T47_06140 [Aureobasidium subglaciale]|nr:hypothetical protein E4T47_06140 [Aureobasidium subglaciale]
MYIPTSEHSVEGLEFIGFEPQAAQNIYKRFPPKGEEFIYGLLDYTTGETYRISREPLSKTPPEEAMKVIGFNKEFRDAILDPEHKSVFETQSLHYWVNDTLTTNHYSLADICDRENGTNTFEESKMLGESLEHCPLHLPEHITLYKPIAAYNYAIIMTNGKTNTGIDMISTDNKTKPSTEKSRKGIDQLYLYLTPEKATAKLFANYTRRRCKYASIWLLCFQVPKSLFTEKETEYLWYLERWKEVVTAMRDRHQSRSMESEVPKAILGIKDKDVIVGRIFTGVEAAIGKTEDMAVVPRIRKTNTLKVKNKRCTQWRFLTRKSLDALNVAIDGKTYIEILDSRRAAMG